MRISLKKIKKEGGKSLQELEHELDQALERGKEKEQEQEQEQKVECSNQLLLMLVKSLKK